MTRGPEPPGRSLTEALADPRKWAGPALCAFVTAGYPSRAEFPGVLRRVAEIADVVEVGAPFSDPMADGVTVQRASRSSLAGGVTLDWILELLAGLPELPAPVVLMSYLNPLLPSGFSRLARRAAASGVAGLVVPDLPLEESAPFHTELSRRGLALIRMVTPATPRARLKRLCGMSEGFVYAVTRTGITGARGPTRDAAGYLRRVRRHSSIPVLAGFGIRTAARIRSIGRHADGVIVGSALIEALERGRDPGAFLRELRDQVTGGRSG